MNAFLRKQLVEFALDYETERHIAEQKAALQANPAWARGYLNLGLLYQTQSKQDLALEHFLKALSLDPRLADAHVAAGQVYAVRGEYDKAWEHAHLAAAFGNRRLLELLERYKEETTDEQGSARRKT